jgi:hypothetical protein
LNVRNCTILVTVTHDISTLHEARDETAGC